MRRLFSSIVFCLLLTGLTEPAIAGEQKKISNLDRGAQLWHERRFSDAELFLEAAVKDDPKSTDARWLHGSNLLRLGRYGEASQELKKSFSPKDSPGHRSMIMQQIAGCDAHSGNWEQSVKHYEELSKTPYRQYDPEVFNDLAGACAMAGMSEKSSAAKKKRLSV